MKVLVTGAAGFIGSHFVDKLLRDGHSVVAIDRFRFGVEEHREFNRDFIRKLTLIKTDISDPALLRLRNIKDIDWVFHFAGKIGNAVSKLDPAGYFHVNVNGTVNILDICRRLRVKKFIYASTASVYGIPDHYPTAENAEIRLDYPYSVTKYLGEVYCIHYCKVYGLPVIVVRLFNVYGPKIREKGHYGPTLSIFLSQLQEGKPLTIRGDGTQKRDFTYIDDVYNAFLELSKSKYVGEVFNIGNGKADSMNTLAKLLGGRIKYVPMVEKEPNLTLADIARISRYTGWSPKIALPEGIKMILK